MGLPPAVARHLDALIPDAAAGGSMAGSLASLGQDVVRAVPSCSSVSLLLPGLAGEIWCTVGTDRRPIAASLSAALSAAPSGGRLILRAGAPGAFLLFADAPGASSAARTDDVVLDAHLHFDAALNTASVLASLTDKRWVAIATGILIDQGFTPERTTSELARRASESGLSPAQVARLIASAWAPADAFDVF